MNIPHPKASEGTMDYLRRVRSYLIAQVVDLEYDLNRMKSDRDRLQELYNEQLEKNNALKHTIRDLKETVRSLSQETNKQDRFNYSQTS